MPCHAKHDMTGCTKSNWLKSRELVAYAPRASGRTEEQLRAFGWRTLLQPNSTPCRPSTGMRWALDNGAWFAHQRNAPWDETAFCKMLDNNAEGADFVIAPDIVAGGTASLDLSVSWLPRLAPYGLPVLIAVQDGMTVNDIQSIVGLNIGIFVGGSTEWKLSTMRTWGALARLRECWLHIGRVNTAKRIRLCIEADAHSFDGSSPVQFPSTLARLDEVRRQMNSWG
jgi:hypothetical protein